MRTAEQLSKGRTLAEIQGMTAELGGAIIGMAAGELTQGRLETARKILEGMAVTNPRDPGVWILLAQVLRRQAHLAGARFCAEVAVRLAPGEEQVRLVRAEALLGCPEQVPFAREELQALTSASGRTGERARALLAALGP